MASVGDASFCGFATSFLFLLSAHSWDFMLSLLFSLRNMKESGEIIFLIWLLFLVPEGQKFNLCVIVIII